MIAHLVKRITAVDRSIKYPLEFVKDNVLGTFIYFRKCDNLERFAYLVLTKFLVSSKGINYKENDRYNSTNHIPPPK